MRNQQANRDIMWRIIEGQLGQIKTYCLGLHEERELDGRIVDSSKESNECGAFYEDAMPNPNGDRMRSLWLCLDGFGAMRTIPEKKAPRTRQR